MPPSLRGKRRNNALAKAESGFRIKTAAGGFELEKDL
jgi:hypothetical protein